MFLTKRSLGDGMSRGLRHPSKRAIRKKKRIYLKANQFQTHGEKIQKNNKEKAFKPTTMNSTTNPNLPTLGKRLYWMKNTFILFAYSTNILVRLLFINMKNSYFTIPRFNTVSFGKHSLRYMGPRVWSSVPSNVKKASTLSSFKYNIRKVDLSMLLDDNNCSNCSLCTS